MPSRWIWISTQRPTGHAAGHMLTVRSLQWSGAPEIAGPAGPRTGWKQGLVTTSRWAGSVVRAAELMVSLGPSLPYPWKLCGPTWPAPRIQSKLS